MKGRTALTAACFIAFALVLSSCLALAGCGQKKEQKAAEQGLDLEKSEVETSAADIDTTATQKSVTNGPGKDETAVVVGIAIDSARSNNPDLPELRAVEAEIVDGRWARVVLEPVDRSTDAASWYLKKENGVWTVFDFGTAVMPENHPEAPAELFE